MEGADYIAVVEITFDKVLACGQNSYTRVGATPRALGAWHHQNTASLNCEVWVLKSA
jgi:hypothetical protein